MLIPLGLKEGIGWVALGVFAAAPAYGEPLLDVDTWGRAGLAAMMFFIAILALRVLQSGIERLPFKKHDSKETAHPLSQELRPECVQIFKTVHDTTTRLDAHIKVLDKGREQNGQLMIELRVMIEKVLLPRVDRIEKMLLHGRTARPDEED